MASLFASRHHSDGHDLTISTIASSVAPAAASPPICMSQGVLGHWKLGVEGEARA